MVSDSFYKLDGQYMHNVTVWHKYKEKHPDRNIKTTDQILCDNYNDIRKVSCKQHIYVMAIKKSAKFKISKKKYPKLETEFPIIKETILKQNGKIEKKKIIVKYIEEKLDPCI